MEQAQSSSAEPGSSEHRVPSRWLVDRDNAVSVAWGVGYCFALVLSVWTFDVLGISPAVIVPVVVFVLPLVVGWAIYLVEQWIFGRPR